MYVRGRGRRTGLKRKSKGNDHYEEGVAGLAPEETILLSVQRTGGKGW